MEKIVDFLFEANMLKRLTRSGYSFSWIRERKCCGTLFYDNFDLFYNGPYGIRS